MTTRSKTQALQRDRREREARRPFDHGGGGQTKRPFDTADLGRVPRPREDDPPYRPWWVIDNGPSDDAR